MRRRAKHPRLSAIFVMRDGVIRERDARSCLPWEMGEMGMVVPGAPEGLQLLGRLGLPIIALASGDSSLSPGRRAAAEMELRESMCASLGALDGRVDSVLLYATSAGKRAETREALARRLREAAQALDLDLPTSFLVSDCWLEIEAALDVGCQPMLVMTGQGSEQMMLPQVMAVRKQTWYAPDLASAALSIGAQVVAYQAQALLEDGIGVPAQRRMDGGDTKHSQTVA